MFADPSTGAIAVVEADMSLDTSKAQDSVLLEVLARGPIGKYAFSLQDARVTGVPLALTFPAVLKLQLHGTATVCATACITCIASLRSVRCTGAFPAG